MKCIALEPPRTFLVGSDTSIRMHDCARILLEPDEQVTFVTDTGAEYDVACKSWGFYATPSLNGRLPQFGLRGVLVKSPAAKVYLCLVERGKETDFQRYLDVEGHVVLGWLDSDSACEALARGLNPSGDGWRA